MVTLVLSDDQLSAIHLLLDRIRARQLQDFGQIGSDVKPDGSLITDCDRWLWCRWFGWLFAGQ